MGSEYNVMSPSNRKWHFYGDLINKSKRVKRDNFKFLAFTLLETKILAAHKLSLTFFIRKMPSYLNYEKYLEFKTKIAEKRTRKPSNNFYVLYNRQKGRCEFCNHHIELKSIEEKTKLGNLKIHNIKPRNIHGVHRGPSNKSLLHESCHEKVYQILEKKQITILPFRKL